MQALGAWGEKTNYGKTTMGIIRTTYLVNEQGIVEHIFTGKQVKTKDTPCRFWVIWRSSRADKSNKTHIGQTWDEACPMLCYIIWYSLLYQSLCVEGNHQLLVGGNYANLHAAVVAADNGLGGATGAVFLRI